MMEWMNCTQIQVKSSHEVSGYGQLKYIIPDILPEYVDKVSLSQYNFQIPFKTTKYLAIILLNSTKLLSLQFFVPTPST